MQEGAAGEFWSLSRFLLSLENLCQMHPSLALALSKDGGLEAIARWAAGVGGRRRGAQVGRGRRGRPGCQQPTPNPLRPSSSAAARSYR